MRPSPEGPSPEAMDAAEAIRLRSAFARVRIALSPWLDGAPGMAGLLSLDRRQLRSALARVRIAPSEASRKGNPRPDGAPGMAGLLSLDRIDQAHHRVPLMTLEAT